jgi:carbon-monoxide dehydrogenase medium subunit
VEQFCLAPGRNVLEPGELLVSLQLPVPAPRSGARYLRFIPRNEMDIAVVGVGANIALSDDGAIADARVALGAVAPTPLYVPDVGDFLRGKLPSDALFAEAGAIARSAATPIGDMRGTAEHRLLLVGVLTRRALRTAYDRARGAA